jgi:hypothetical protein
MLALLERLDSKELDRRQERRDAVDMLPAGTLASLWLTSTRPMSCRRRPAIGDAVDRHIRAIEDWLPVVEDEHLSEQQAIHSKLLLALTDRMPARLNTLALGARPDRHRDGYLLQSSRLRQRLRG